MPDTGAESGFTKQGPQKETEQTHSMEMLLMRKPTVRTTNSFQRHKPTHCYGTPNQYSTPVLINRSLNVQLLAALNANEDSQPFVCRAHLRLFLKQAERK